MIDLSRYIDTKEKNASILLIIVCGLYILPLINANIFYVDDISRATTGYVGWGILGRPLSDSVMLLLSFSEFRLTDASPMPIIISAMTLSLAILYCAKSQLGKISLLTVSVFLPAILNPFFLQNLSYRYDNLPMSLGVALSMLSFAMCRQASKKLVFLSFVMLSCTLCLYQASINIFIGLIAVGIIIDHANRNHYMTAKNFLTKSFVFISSYAFYMIVISPVYSKTNRGETVSFNKDAIDTIFGNLKSCIKLIELLITNETIKYFSPIIIISLTSLIFLVIKSMQENKGAITLISTSLLIASPIIAVLSLTGPLFLLKGFGFVPRVMTGFSGTVMYFLILFYIALKYITKRKEFLWVASLYMIVPILYSFSLCYTYVNASRGQSELEYSTINSAFNVMINNKSIMNSKVIALGESSTSDIFKVSAFKFPIINSLYKKSYDWTIFMQLEKLGMDNMEFTFNRSESEQIRVAACKDESTYITDNPLYSIKHYSGGYIAWFKNNHNSMC